MPDVLGRRALGRATLARQLLLSRSAIAPTDAVHHLVGLQAQNPGDPYLALWSRLDPFDPFDVGRLVEERALVRIVAMRATIHLLTADDCLALRPLCQPVLDAELRRHRDHAPHLRDADLAPVLAHAAELLAAEPMPPAALGRALAERFPALDGAAMSYAARNLLPLVQVPPRGVWGRRGQVTVTTAESWLGRPMAADPSVEQLVERYLRAFGPALPADLAAWSRLAGFAEIVERMGSRLRTFHDERGRRLVDVPDAPLPDPDTPAPVRILPEYDNALLSHADRSRYTPDDVAALATTGRVHGAALVDGSIAADVVPHALLDGDRAVMTVRHLRRLGRRDRAELAAEAMRAATFLEPDAPSIDVRLEGAGRVTGDERPPPVRVRVLRPLTDFLHTEAAGGVVLLGATVVALIWANSMWQASYVDLWHHQLTIGVAGHDISLDLHGWINEGLMAIFFFVVGLEIKRELVVGELRQPRRAALPAIAAFGGMVVPALIYAAFNAGGPGANGWAIPMATDIAMAVGVLSVLASAIDPALKLFLLALAIVDDIGAIVVIAVFYSKDFDAVAATIAVALVGAVLACRALGVRTVAVYAVLGVALWVAVYESGIQATIAGVAVGLLTPTGPRRPEDPEGPSTVEWLEHLLHRWSSFLIVPLFALANAGVVVSSQALADAWSSPITNGVVAGLVVGKLVGVSAFTWLALRLGIGELPVGTPWRSVIGIGALAGIGFTVSLFVTDLAFDDPLLQDDAKIAILIASTLAALLGSAILFQARSAARSRA